MLLLIILETDKSQSSAVCSSNKDSEITTVPVLKILGYNNDENYTRRPFVILSLQIHTCFALFCLIAEALTLVKLYLAPSSAALSLAAAMQTDQT